LGPDGPPALALFFIPGSGGLQVAEALQADFQRAGIQVELRPMDRGALTDATHKGEPDLFRLSWIADFPDADNFLHIFHSSRHGSAGNRAHYTNAQVDELLDRERHEPDLAKRVELFKEIEKLIVADAPWVFLSHGQTHLLVKPYVRGFRLTPMDVGSSVNQVDFAAVRMEESGP